MRIQKRQERHVARDITYANSAQTKGGRAIIRVMENVTGRIGLIKRAKGYEVEVANGRDFWEVMVERYGLSMDIIGGSLENIPKEGPLILVANHPYGILDGMMMGHILSTVRGDFRILAHQVFRKAEDLHKVILPVSFDETKEAMKVNLETRKESLRYLAQGGAIGIFPGGTVSTGAKPFSRPLDPGWRTFTAKMVAKSGAQVVPIYFDGTNSKLFQVASHLHSTLRMALLVKEFKKKTGEPVRMAIGQPLPAEEIASLSKDSRAMMEYLRRETYRLSPDPVGDDDFGFEFEDKHRSS